MSTPARGPRARLILVVPAAIALLLGIDAGLLLLGLPAPLAADRLPDLHAPLLVFGFVGALISLERAVALRTWWAFGAPLLLVVGAFLALSPLALVIGQALIAAGVAVHLAQYAAIWQRQPASATAIQALGAACALVAAITWTGGVPSPVLVPLLASFLVLTIAGERLELARVTAPGLTAERLLYGAALALAASAVLTLSYPIIAVPVCGGLLLALTALLLRYDVARATIRQRGLPRYVAVNLLAGYGWLVVAGSGWLLGGSRTEGALYDATTHAVFLGFVIALIMAHAPLILPAVLRVRIPYHPALYVPVGLLQLSLLVRLVVGDAWGSVLGLQIGGIGNALSILLFGATVVVLSTRASRAAKRGTNVAP